MIFAMDDLIAPSANQLSDAIRTGLYLCAAAGIILHCVSKIRDLWFSPPKVEIKDVGNGKAITVNIEGAVTRGEFDALHNYSHDKMHEMQNWQQQITSRLDHLETLQAKTLEAIISQGVDRGRR